MDVPISVIVFGLLMLAWAALKIYEWVYGPIGPRSPKSLREPLLDTVDYLAKYGLAPDSPAPEPLSDIVRDARDEMYDNPALVARVRAFAERASAQDIQALYAAIDELASPRDKEPADVARSIRPSATSGPRQRDMRVAIKDGIEARWRALQPALLDQIADRMDAGDNPVILGKKLGWAAFCLSTSVKVELAEALDARGTQTRWRKIRLTVANSNLVGTLDVLALEGLMHQDREMAEAGAAMVLGDLAFHYEKASPSSGYFDAYRKSINAAMARFDRPGPNVRDLKARMDAADARQTARRN